MNQDLASYYKQRAKEYDKVYQIPEEQEDLRKASELFQGIFKHKSVLEIACGTGYWTEQISKTASTILATDINPSTIDIARTRNFHSPVTFEVADMNRLAPSQKYEGFFGGFIWSHVLVQDLDHLLSRINNQVINNGDIVFIDSKQVEGAYHNRKRITRVDEQGNTFQTRQLEDGTTHEVLKNFPSARFLLDKLSVIATRVNVIELEYYWIAACKLK